MASNHTTALQEIIATGLATTRRELQEAEAYLPSFVWKELAKLPGCGQLDRGFVRVYCPACQHDKIVAFSCKARATCSACVGRRMNELAFHLDDHVVPLAPVRQFVLTLPMQLRFLVAKNARLLSAVRRVFVQTVSTFYKQRARLICSVKDQRTAGLCVVQRFSSSLALNPHLHALFVDGAYHHSEETGSLTLVATPAIEKKMRDALLERIVRRVFMLLKHRGLVGDDGFTSSPDTELDAQTQLMFEAMRPAQTRSNPKKHLHSPNASVHRGFSLHCETRAKAHDQAARLRLFRYVLRPAIAADKLQFDGKLVTFEMKRFLSDGTKFLKFSVQAFIRRIALLIPRPRQCEVTYCGLFTSNAKGREQVVRVATHRRAKAKVASSDTFPTPASAPTLAGPSMSWADLKKRTFGIDELECEHCGQRMRVLCAITDPAAIKRFLDHLGIGVATTTLNRNRGPPQQDLLFDPAL